MNKISFIIPVYNCKDYLLRCIESIEKLNLFDYEILLIDDGSIDGSSDLCDDIVKRNSNIRCYHQSNKGVSASRNLGLTQASGEYILFVDADDSFDPQGMKKVLKCLNDETIDLVIYGMTFDFYYKGSLYRRDELRTPFSGIVGKSEWIDHLEKLYSANVLNPIWNKIFKRKVLIDNKLKLREDMFLYEDLEYSLRCLTYCDKVLFYPEAIYHYRQSEDEGNAGRRLKRVAHISELVSIIEAAVKELATSKENTARSDQIDSILLSLYLVLAREKIAVSNNKEIRQICNDFSIWLENRNRIAPGSQKKFINYLMNQEIGRIVVNRTYVSLRHRIAVILKSLIAKKKYRDGKKTWL